MWVSALDLPQALEIDEERVHHPADGHEVQRRANPRDDTAVEELAQPLQPEGDGDK
eukprot:CAMPEP_0195118536 /NCGR_PEP_ID=MMETSP0448-20130528/117237_1 /TAXON_ID=66468 /ORGANISM="Heterocapsa triquestra, Strain CCMP 448" /LENGTH=55 /DNA_ID=CAMNT_0040155809 /DNA_START=17 /DNA_END=181 /DNA_ORIENTATION=-